MGVFWKGGECFLSMPDGSVRGLSGRVEELHVQVVAGKELPQMDVGADVSEEEREEGIGVTCDGFCRVSVGDREYKTEVVPDSLDPEWNEEFIFVITDPGDERGEVFRQLTDMTKLRITVLDWDADGSEDFVGLVEIPVTDLHGDDPEGRSVFVEEWYELMHRDGSKPRAKKNGSPGKGWLHLRCAMRCGVQVQQLNRLRGADWINPSKFVEALESLPKHFCPGDEQVIDTVCSLLLKRDKRVPDLPKQHLQLLKERGVPLGLAVHKGKDLDTSGEPLGVLLEEMLKRKVNLEATFDMDPRDVHFHTMRTHWPARLAAVKAVGLFSLVGQEKTKVAVQAVLTVAHDESPVVRVAALQVITQLCVKGDLGIVHLFVELLTDEHRSVRKAAVHGLGKVCVKNHPETVKVVCDLLEHRQDEMRAFARRALAAVVTKGNTLAILEVSSRLESLSHTVRLAAMACFDVVAEKGDRKLVAEVINRLQHPAEQVRMAALESLKVVAARGDRFALAAVSNLMTHPDWQIRQVAATGVRVVAKPVDVGAIQCVVRHLMIHSESSEVLEGAKYVSMPTADRAVGWRDAEMAKTNRDLRDHETEAALDVFTPRAEHFLPVIRKVTVSIHVPVIPSNANAETVAHAWWEDKHAHDVMRHRYKWGQFSGSTPVSHQPSPSLLPRSLSNLSQSLIIEQPLDTKELESAAGTLSGIGGEGGVVAQDSRDSLISRASLQTSISSERTHHKTPAGHGPSHAPVRMTISEVRAEAVRQSRELVLDVCTKLLYPRVDAETQQPYDEFPTGPEFFAAIDRVLAHHAALREEWRWELTFPRVEADESIDFGLVGMMLQKNDNNKSGLEFAAKVISESLGKTWVSRKETFKRIGSSAFITAGVRDIASGEGAARKAGTLIVNVKSAENMPHVEGAIDAFVSLEIPGGGDAVRTHIKMDQECPEWNETFHMPLTHTMMQLEQHKNEGDERGFTPQTPGGTGNSTLGLYYDTLLTLPFTKTELMGTAMATFLKAIENEVLPPPPPPNPHNQGPTPPPQARVQILRQSQIGPRTQELLLRINTGDFVLTLSMREKLNEKKIATLLQEKQLIDENRFDLVGTDPVTTSESLLVTSAPLLAHLWHFRLSDPPVLLGTVSLPIVPLVNTIKAAGGYTTLERAFDVRDRGGEIVTTGGGKCALRLSVKIVEERKGVSEAEGQARQREKQHMAQMIRVLAADTLCALSDGAVESVLEELLYCFRSSSGDVHDMVEATVRRIANPPHAAPLTGVTWYESGAVKERVVTCSQDGSIKMWRVSDGFMEFSLEGHDVQGEGGGVRSVSSENGRVVSGGADGTVRVWDLVSREERVVLPDASPAVVKCVSLSGDGRLILAGGGGALDDNKQRTGWDESDDVSARVLAWRLIPMTEAEGLGEASGMLGSFLGGGGNGKTRSRVGSATSREEAAESSKGSVLGATAPTSFGALSKEHVRIAEILAGCAEKAATEVKFRIILPLVERIVLWGGSAELCESKLPGKLPPASKDVARAAIHQFSLDMAKTGRPTDFPTWMRTLVIRLRREKRNIKTLKVQRIPSDVRSSVTPAAGMSAAQIKSITKQRDAKSFNPTAEAHHAVTCLVSDPHDEHYFASGGEDGVVRVWELNETADLGPIRGANTGVKTMTLETPAQQVAELVEHTARVTAVAYHPKTRGILISASRSILIWSVELAASLMALAAPLESGFVTCLHVSPDGHMVAAGSHAGGVRVWDLDVQFLGMSAGKPEFDTLVSLPRESSFVHQGGVTAIAFNKSGTFVASVGNDRACLVLKASTGHEIRVLSGDPERMGVRQGVCIGALAQGLGHKDERVRVGAKNLIPLACEPGDPGAIAKLCGELGNGDAEVRTVALELLELICSENPGGGRTEAVLVCSRLLVHKDPIIRQDAVKGASHVLGDDVGLCERLCDLANRLIASKTAAGETFLSVAAEALLPLGGEAGLGEARLVSYLRRWDNEKEWGARLVKLEGLVHVGILFEATDWRGLAGMMAHHDTDVREAAGEAASKLAEREDATECVAWMLPWCSRVECGQQHVMVDARMAVGRVVTAMLLTEMDEYVDWQQDVVIRQASGGSVDADEMFGYVSSL